MDSNNQTITVPLVISAIIVVFITWISHEYIHWLTGELLGYDQTMRLNGVSFLPGQYPTEADKALISISAPIFTVLQGIFVFLFLKSRGWNKYIYQLLIITFYMRFLAGVMNFIMPNDEARTGLYLGIGKHTLSFLISAFLFFLVYKISTKYRLTSKFQLWTSLSLIVGIILLIFIDQYFKIKII